MTALRIPRASELLPCNAHAISYQALLALASVRLQVIHRSCGWGSDGAFAWRVSKASTFCLPLSSPFSLALSLSLPLPPLCRPSSPSLSLSLSLSASWSLSPSPASCCAVSVSVFRSVCLAASGLPLPLHCLFPHVLLPADPSANLWPPSWHYGARLCGITGVPPIAAPPSIATWPCRALYVCRVVYTCLASMLHARAGIASSSPSYLPAVCAHG